jgi:ankyrin repeat protein
MIALLPRQTLITVDAANIRDEDGKSVMHTAAEQGSLAACKIILDIGEAETLRHRDNQNRTPLILAAMAGHGEVVNFFLAQGGQ